MQSQKTAQFVSQFWKNSVIPALSEFISIPCKSPDFDTNWEKNGHLLKAAQLMAQWANAQKIPGLTSKIIQTRGKSPLLYVEIPGQKKNGVLFYGHLDKMPETEGWSKGLGAWKPVVKNHRLYGRGSVDDGYAFFSYITAIKALEEQKIPYSRCVFLIEAGEECGSKDFPYYLKQLRKQLGTIDLVVCLDASANDYQRLWCTTSLRGLIKASLNVAVLKKAVHSGMASGIIPSSFRILRQLLDRLENSKTGEILLKSCHVKIPSAYRKDVKILSKILGRSIYTSFPRLTKLKPVTNNLSELLLNRDWRPALTIIGAEQLPPPQDASNAILPATTLILSIRTPPLCDPKLAAKNIKKLLLANPPYQAKINFTTHITMPGWTTPQTKSWLKRALSDASKTYFGKPMQQTGDGVGIGVILMLKKTFSKAQFILSGVGGPLSHEHGPNESLDLPAAQKLTCCLAHILEQQYRNIKK